MLHLFIKHLVVVFIAVARALPGFSVCWSVLASLLLPYFPLVHVIAALLLFASSPDHRPEPPSLLVVCFACPSLFQFTISGV